MKISRKKKEERRNVLPSMRQPSELLPSFFTSASNARMASLILPAIKNSMPWENKSTLSSTFS